LYIHFTTTTAAGGGGVSQNCALFIFPPTKVISTRVIPFHILENIRHW